MGEPIFEQVRTILWPHYGALVEVYGQEIEVEHRIRAFLPATKRAVEWLADRTLDELPAEAIDVFAKAQALLTAAGVLAQTGRAYSGRIEDSLPAAIVAERAEGGEYSETVAAWVAEGRAIATGLREASE